MSFGRATASRSRAARRRRRARISRCGGLLLLLALGTAGVLLAPPAQAASLTWTGLGSTNNWSDGANWSTGSPPGAADVAIFNATSTKDAVINGAVNVAGIQIAAGYSGTITQGAAVAAAVGSSGFSQASGTFVGSSSAITVNGGFTLSGGSFTSTAGTLSVSGAFTHSAGTFLDNGGTVAFTGGATTIAVPSTETFNHLRFAPTSGGAAKTVTSGTTLVVEGTLTLTEGSIASGTVAARGAVTQASTFDGGTGLVVIDGTADQTFTGTATPTTGTLPNLEIAKPSGTLTLVGTIRTTHNWTSTSGNLDPGTSTIVFAGTLGVTGSQGLNAVEIRGAVSVPVDTLLTVATLTMPSAVALTVNGSVTVSGALTLTDGSIAGSGSVTALGDLTQASTFDGGAGLVIIDGTADQSFTGTATTTTGTLPNLEIAKPSGTLTLVGTIRTTHNWTYTSGGLNAGTSTVVFAATATITGSHELANVTFNGGGSTYTITSGTTLSANATLTLTDGSINTGTVTARGDLTQASTFDGGTGLVVIDGTADQTWTGTATPTTGGLPNLEIAKPSGTLTLVGTIRTKSGWTYTSGNLDAGNSTVVFAGTLTLTGSHELANVTFNGGGSTYTITSGTTLTANATLTLTDGSINTGTVTARGDLTQASTFDGGTGLVVIDGTADQTFTGTATPTTGTLPNLEIAKPSGTLTLVGTIRTTHNWTSTSGNLDPGTSTIVFAGTLGVTGSQGLNAVEIRGAVSVPVDTLLTVATLTMPSAVALTVNGSVTVSGALTLTDGSIAGSGSVTALGDLTQASTFDGGAGLVIIDGTADQSFTGTATTTTGTLPNLEIAKPSGTLTLVGTIRTTHNWTYTSGGLNAGTSTVVFAATATITGSHELANVTFNGGGSTYTITSGTTLSANGALTLTDGSINTGTVTARGDLTQASTFDGGTGLVVIDGTADQTWTGTATPTTGGLPNLEIAKPSGTLTLVGTIRTKSGWTYTSGNLDAGNSTVVFAGTLTLTGSHELANVTFNGGGSTYTITSGTTLTANATLTLTDGSINTGTVTARGDLTQASTFDGGTGLVVIDGTADQTFTGTATPTTGTLPNLEIAKPSGTLTLVGTIRTTHNWTSTSGNLDPGTSTIVFAGTLGVTGSQGLNAVEIRGAVSVPVDTLLTVATLTMPSAVALTVNGSVTVSGALTLTDGSIAGSGSVTALGDLTQASTFDGGAGLVIIDGTADQSFTGTATTTTGTLPNLEIAKPSGTLTLVGTIRTTHNWTYTSGGLNAGTSTVVFAATATITGSHELANVTFNGGGSTYTITSGTTLSANATLTLTDGSINTGTVTARGDLTQASTFDGGTGLVVIDGTADQTWTGTATPTTGGLPNLEIAKPSGTLTLVGTIRTKSGWTYTSGNLDAGNSTVVFAGTLTLTGSHELANVTFNGGGSTYTITSGTTLTANATLTLTDGSINTGTVTARGDLTQASTFDGGTGLVVIDGTADQTFTGTATPTTGTLPNLEIAKPSGTLTLVGTIRTTHNWTSTSGNLDPGTSTIVFAGTEFVSSSGMSFANVTVDGGPLSSGVTLVGGPLIVTRTLSLASGTITTGSSKVVVAPSGSVVRVSGHVNGNLQRSIPTGSAVSVEFEIGDASVYAPVVVSFGTVTEAGEVTVDTVAGKHADIARSGVSATNGVNRWWTITNTTTQFDTYNVAFSFVAADLDPAADPSRFTVAKQDGTVWTWPSTSAASTTSIEAVGMTSFSDFVVGQPQADLRITVGGPAKPVVVGGTLTSAFTVSNAGPAPASKVTVTYRLPARMAWRSVDPSQGSCTKSTGSSKCDLGTLAVAATATITIRVTATAPGSATHSAAVTSAEIDPDLTNNTASWTSTVTGNPPDHLEAAPAGAAGPNTMPMPNASDERASDSAASERREAADPPNGERRTRSRDATPSKRTQDLISPAGAGRGTSPGSVPTTPLSVGILLALGALLGVSVRLTRRAQPRHTS